MNEEATPAFNSMNPAFARDLCPPYRAPSRMLTVRSIVPSVPYPPLVGVTDHRRSR